MMLAHPEISHVFDFEIPYVNTLVIENRQFLREILQDIRTQLDGSRGDTVISENNIPTELARSAEMLNDFVPFTMNRKPLVTKLAASLERTSLEDEHYMETQELLQRIESYILELAEDLPCDVNCTKVSMNAILKAAGLEIYELAGEQLDTLVDYMGLVCDLDRDKLFILVNFRSYFDDMETKAFIRTVIDHNLHVLMIESNAHPLVYGEKRITIDNDLCEF